MTVHKVIDDFTPEQLAKLKAMKQAESKSKASAFFRDDELLLAEFGKYYGWQAIRDVMADEVSYDTFIALLNAGRSLAIRDRILRVNDMYVAVGASQAKKGDKVLKQYVKQLERGI